MVPLLGGELAERARNLIATQAIDDGGSNDLGERLVLLVVVLKGGEELLEDGIHVGRQCRLACRRHWEIL